ncbi:MAG: ComEC family competence protein [Alphaproteobacteria bacterium]|nr:ComEC family competence protein [Alphaproteobacteria bacterium]
MRTDDASAPSIADGPRQTAWEAGFVSIVASLNARIEALFEAERDQLALWLPIGLGVGIAAWFTLPDKGSWIAFLLIASGLALAPRAMTPGTRWARALSLFWLAAAFGCGLVWIKAERAAAPVLAHPRMAQFSAMLEQVQPVPARELTRLVVAPIRAPELPARLRINVDQDKVIAGLAPGATLRLRAWLMPPAPMAVPGAYDFSRAAWFNGIGGSGRALDIALESEAPSQGWGAMLADMRQRLSAHIRDRLAGGAGGIAAALATGDQGGVPESDADAMRQSGLAHLLSVSGLHLTAVVGAVMLLTLALLALSPALALRWPLVLIAAGAAALAGIAYTLLTGAEVPTVRSCVAALLVLVGIAFGREALTLRLVATGALIVLLLWPEALVGPSFQLSFAAITAIVALHEHPRLHALFARRDEPLPARLGRALLALALTGLAVELALTPIALYHFHKAGLYGALANMIAIPLTTFVVMPLEAAALLLDLGGLGAPLWWATGAALHGLLALAHATASVPGAVATLPTMPVAAFALMIGGGVWLLLWRTPWRRWGVVPLAAGALWTLATPGPDLIVTGDGRHLALRTDDGGFAILRSRAGDYVRDLLGESSGSQGELGALEEWRGARCNKDFCSADMIRGGRRWTILATRSPYLVPYEALSRACAHADIIVSDRRLPSGCAPRWLKADRAFLERTGGIAVRLGREPRVRTVADLVGRHPWAQTRGS